MGKLSAKVREELWSRICESIRTGQATMVYSINNEQGYAFLTHNTTWIATDYEGITLMKRPLLPNSDFIDTPLLKPGFSKASKYDRIGRGKKNKISVDYIIMDVETTGLDYDKDRILEIGLLKIKGDEIKEQLQCFVQGKKAIPEAVTKLTGITDELIEKQGITEKEAFKKIEEFIDCDLIIGYHVQFDINFILRMAERVGKCLMVKRTRDVLQLARQKIDELENYQLKTVAEYFSLDTSEMHRALADCILTHKIYLELNKL